MAEINFSYRSFFKEKKQRKEQEKERRGGRRRRRQKGKSKGRREVRSKGWGNEKTNRKRKWSQAERKAPILKTEVKNFFKKIK